MISLVCLCLAVQEYGTLPVRIKFDNGSVFTYGYGILPSLKDKGGDHPLDLKSFVRWRIDNRKRGDPDKSANNLAAQERSGLGYSIKQAVRVSKNSALCIVGYSHANLKGTSSFVQDLVLLNTEGKVTLTFKRTIGPDGGLLGNDFGRRLYWSQKQLLLRTRGGFEILDAAGAKTGSISIPTFLFQFGMNPRGDLLMVGGAKNGYSFSIYDLRKRRLKAFAITPVKDELKSIFHELTYTLRSPKVIHIWLEGIDYNGIGPSKRAHYLFDANTGKAIKKYISSD